MTKVNPLQSLQSLVSIFGHRSRRPQRSKLWVEELEQRCLLATWYPLGPAPQVNNNVPLSGRVAALAVGEDNSGYMALFAGTASGGVWRTSEEVDDFGDGTGEFSDPPTWTQVSDNLYAGTSYDGTNAPLSAQANPNVNNIGAVAVDPNNQQTIYAGTGEANYSFDCGTGAGILKSTDGGAHWVIVSTGPNNAFVGQSVSKIVVTPSGIFAAIVPTGQVAPTSSDGVYQSANGGVTWTKKDIGVGPIIVTDLAYANNTLYAGLGNPFGLKNNVSAPSLNIGSVGIYSSFYTGYGNTWLGWSPLRGDGAPYAGIASTQFSNSPGPVGRISLAAAPDGTAIYAAIASPKIVNTTGPTGGSSPLFQVIKSTNRGTSWSVLVDSNTNSNVIGSFGSVGSYYLSLGVDAADNVFLGGERVFRLANGANDWTQPSGGQSPHADHHAWAFTSSAAYDGNDGGVWQFNGTWLSMNGGGSTTLNTTQIRGVAVNQLATPTLIEGSQDNGFGSKSGVTATSGTTWNGIGGLMGDGYGVRYSSPTSTWGYAINRDANGSLVYWTDGQPIATPHNIARGSNNLGRNTVLAVSPTNPGHVLWGGTDLLETQNGNSARSTDVSWYTAGGRWWNTLPSGTITAIAFETDSMVYVGFSNGQLWWTSDVTANYPSWHRIDNQFPGTVNWGTAQITSIVPAMTQDGWRLYVTENGANNNVFSISFNYTSQSFSAVNWQLPNMPVSAGAYYDGGPDKQALFIGTASQVYYYLIGSGNPTWLVYGTNLPIVQVTDLQIYNRTPTLIAATYGRGVWAVPIEFPAVPAPGLGAAVEGNRQGGIAFGPFPGSSTYVSIQIDWGDGNTSTSTPSDPNADADLTQTDAFAPWVVTGGHTYDEEGLYTATATIYDGSYDFTGTPPTPLATETLIIDVTDATLTAQVPSISGAVGSAVPSGQPIASFTDANPFGDASEFNVSVAWGDGSQDSSSGSSPQLSVTADSTVAGLYYIWGSHTYTNDGTFTVKAIINDDGGSNTTASGTATISGPISAVPVTVSGVAITPITNTVVATFTTNISGATAVDFTGSIDWGNSVTSTATIVSDGVGGFIVQGSNTYSSEGDYALGITVQDTVTSDSVTLQGDAPIADAPLAAQPITIASPQNQQFTSLGLASFTDADPSGTTSDYTSTIDWGDGTSDEPDVTVGTITTDDDGTFIVSGDHSYNAPGAYALNITILDAGGSAVTVSNSISVELAASDLWYPVNFGTITNVDASPSGLLSGVVYTGTGSVGVVAINEDPTAVGNAVVTAAGGSVTVNSDGSFSYTPPTLYTASDSFDVTIGDGASSATATVNLTLTDALAGFASFSNPHDQTLTVAAASGLLSVSSDADNNPLTVAAINGNTGNVAAATTTTMGGTLTARLRSLRTRGGGMSFIEKPGAA